MPPDGKDPYLYPDSDVLRDKPGLRTADALVAYEHEQAVWRLDEVRRWPPARLFDLETPCRFHGHIFQDVYDWAGSMRSLDIAKGGLMFCRPGFIPTA